MAFLGLLAACVCVCVFVRIQKEIRDHLQSETQAKQDEENRIVSHPKSRISHRNMVDIVATL